MWVLETGSSARTASTLNPWPTPLASCLHSCTWIAPGTAFSSGHPNAYQMTSPGGSDLYFSYGPNILDHWLQSKAMVNKFPASIYWEVLCDDHSFSYFSCCLPFCPWPHSTFQIVSSWQIHRDRKTELGREKRTLMRGKYGSFFLFRHIF